jgi:hypothetical protein
MIMLLGILMALRLSAQEIILLRPDAKVDPGAPAEHVEERGKNGVTDRSITNVSQRRLPSTSPSGRTPPGRVS